MSPPELLAVLDGIQALLLDVDDTIVDTEGAMVEAGTVAAAAVWPEREGEHRAVAQRYYDDPERWFRRYAAGDVGFDAMRAGRLHEVARTLGLDLSEGAQRRYEEAYAAAFRTAQRLFPDVPPLLEAAEHAGLPVALLTNSAHAPTPGQARGPRSRRPLRRRRHHRHARLRQTGRTGLPRGVPAGGRRPRLRRLPR